ncbi:hypothetical protein [Lysobacter sp. D1-1-M9]|uniref:hypothetical protein n=2 Tax=Novilysobacter TaxID=3382699 RepID=UPI002FCCB2B2
MRAPDSDALRGFPRSWFCRALQEYGGDLADLNAQLALKPDPEHAFAVGAWPRPYYPRAIAPAFFDRAFAGRNPDNWEWVERAESGWCFNLFLRVAIHLPGSEDWLFRGLHPYLRSTPPPIDHAHNLLRVCLQRLGLRVLPEPALRTVLRLESDRGRQVAQRGVDLLVKAAEPIHLMTLFALWHVTHWERPYSANAQDLLRACCAASRRFLGRSEFQVNSCTRAAADHVEISLGAIRHVIKHDGFRVPRSTKALERIAFFPLLVRDFKDRDAAISCASAGTAVAMDDFLFFEPAPYRRDVIPTGHELDLVTGLLLKAATFTKDDILVYDRDPAVLKQLSEPLERPVVRKRVAARS